MGMNITAQELNNRFALDGHAPPSYGGVLGCLGLFEGPKQDSGRATCRTLLV